MNINNIELVHPEFIIPFLLRCVSDHAIKIVHFKGEGAIVIMAIIPVKLYCCPLKIDFTHVANSLGTHKQNSFLMQVVLVEVLCYTLYDIYEYFTEIQPLK